MSQLVRIDSPTRPSPAKTTSWSASLVLAFLALTALPGCAVVKGIFKAGVWVGVLAVIGLVVVIGGLMSFLRKK